VQLVTASSDSYSIGDVSRFVRASWLANRIDASIDHERFRSVVAVHDTDDYGTCKYFDKRRWLRAKTMRAIELGLDRASGASILDLGCGPGYFLYVCKYFGHRPHGVDLPDTPFFNAMIEFFDIPRTNLRIEPFKELPLLPRKFDVITAHQICFNGHKTEALWDIPQWDFLLRDLKKNHLNPGGIVALEFNEEPKRGFFSKPLRDFFTANAGRIYRGRVVLPAGS
jgi:SAM-dependent methyltransferase